MGRSQYLFSHQVPSQDEVLRILMERHSRFGHRVTDGAKVVNVIQINTDKKPRSRGGGSGHQKPEGPQRGQKHTGSFHSGNKILKQGEAMSIRLRAEGRQTPG